MDRQCGIDDANPRSDAGSAMIMTLMVMALVTALATTVSVVTVNNLQSSSRAQQAGSALNAAEAGVAQAMSYLRNSGVRDLGCAATPVNTCAANSYGSTSAPKTVVMDGRTDQTYRVWIVPVAPFPVNDPGRYVIHSTGSAAGSAVREVTSDVSVTSTNVPLGIFAKTINGGGNASVSRASIFSSGCVWDRNHIGMTGVDAAYDIPVGVHTSSRITTDHGSGTNCPATSGDIHKTGQPCDTRYPNDQDHFGGNLGTSCGGVQSTYDKYYGPKNYDADPEYEVHGSYIADESSLKRLFGIDQTGLTESQLDKLRSVAEGQGNYYKTTASTWDDVPINDVNAVLFFDLTALDPGGTVDLNDIVGFGRDPVLSATDLLCGTRSLIIVIKDGNATLNSNRQLVASLFMHGNAPNGQVSRANGNAEFIGTIYADTVNLVGNMRLSLDECFLSNLSPALLDLTPTAYREIDR